MSQLDTIWLKSKSVRQPGRVEKNTGTPKKYRDTISIKETVSPRQVGLLSFYQSHFYAATFTWISSSKSG